MTLLAAKSVTTFSCVCLEEHFIVHLTFRVSIVGRTRQEKRSSPRCFRIEKIQNGTFSVVISNHISNGKISEFFEDALSTETWLDVEDKV